MGRKARLHRVSSKDKENRLNLLKNIETQLNSLSTLELKVILAIYHQEIPDGNKQEIIKEIMNYIPSFEIKKVLDHMVKIRNILKFIVYLEKTEFDVLTSIYSIDQNLDKESKLLEIFNLRPLGHLEKDLLNFGKIRVLIIRLKELNDYEFEILFKDENHDINNVFKNYSPQTINHTLSKLNQIRIYIDEFNKLTPYDIDYLLSIKSLEITGSKEDKIKFLLETCSFSEIHNLLYDVNKFNIVRQDLENLDSLDLNMILLLNGKSLTFPKDKQILKIFKEIPLIKLKSDLVRIKHLNHLEDNEFTLIQEGLKRSSFKDLSIFCGNKNHNKFNLKELFEKSFILILNKYNLINTNTINNAISNNNSDDYDNLDLDLDLEL